MRKEARAWCQTPPPPHKKIKQNTPDNQSHMNMQLVSLSEPTHTQGVTTQTKDKPPTFSCHRADLNALVKDLPCQTKPQSNMTRKVLGPSIWMDGSCWTLDTLFGSRKPTFWLFWSRIDGDSWLSWWFSRPIDFPNTPNPKDPSDGSSETERNIGGGGWSEPFRHLPAPGCSRTLRGSAPLAAVAWPKVSRDVVPMASKLPLFFEATGTPTWRVFLQMGSSSSLFLNQILFNTRSTPRSHSPLNLFGGGIPKQAHPERPRPAGRALVVGKWVLGGRFDPNWAPTHEEI